MSQSYPVMFEGYMDPDARRVESLASNGQVARFGAGAIYEVGRLARDAGITHALLVTDKHFVPGEAVRVVRQSLAKEGIDCTVFPVPPRTPLQADVGAATGVLRGNDCDGVLSLGGGSVQDIGKCTALLASNPGTLHRFAHGQEPIAETLPTIAIPSTAGTGAERSAYAFVIDEQGREHMVIHDDHLVPRVAIIDPLLHVSMPRKLTAATGLNALAGAVEAVLSPQHTDASDEDATAAIRAISENLRAAVNDGEDLDARAALARASYQAGKAFEASGLGIVDSISLVLQSIFDIPASTANAILLPHVMRYERIAAEDRLDRVAEALGTPAARDEEHAAVAAVKELQQDVGFTQDLSDYGLSWDDLYLVSRNILHHPFADRDPRPLDEEGVVDILADAMGRQETSSTPHQVKAPRSA